MRMSGQYGDPIEGCCCGGLRDSYNSKVPREVATLLRGFEESRQSIPLGSVYGKAACTRSCGSRFEGRRIANLSKAVQQAARRPLGVSRREMPRGGVIGSGPYTKSCARNWAFKHWKSGGPSLSSATTVRSFCWFLCPFYRWTATCREHIELRWATPNELKTMKLAPSDGAVRWLSPLTIDAIVRLEGWIQRHAPKGMVLLGTKPSRPVWPTFPARQRPLHLPISPPSSQESACRRRGLRRRPRLKPPPILRSGNSAARSPGRGRHDARERLLP